MNDAQEQRRTAFKVKIQAWAKRLKVKPRQVRIQAMRQKWGSCSTLGYVSFASDLLRKPADFQEYVIVHELLHLRVPNHSKLFRASLIAHLPGLRTESYIAERARRGSVPKALKILKRAGVGKPPMKGDELPARRKRT
jgi:predicted metal-dependent hydrolase